MLLYIVDIFEKNQSMNMDNLKIEVDDGDDQEFKRVKSHRNPKKVDMNNSIELFNVNNIPGKEDYVKDVDNKNDRDDMKGVRLQDLVSKQLEVIKENNEKLAKENEELKQKMAEIEKK